MNTTYKPRIPVDPAYVQAIGRAFYNFTYLEGIVIDLLHKLGATLPKRATGGIIAEIFLRSIEAAAPTIPKMLAKRLRRFYNTYFALKEDRDKLLHARPFSAVCGTQRLAAGQRDWTVESVYEAAKAFEDAAITGSDIFHGSLAKIYP